MEKNSDQVSNSLEPEISPCSRKGRRKFNRKLKNGSRDLHGGVEIGSSLNGSIVNSGSEVALGPLVGPLQPSAVSPLNPEHHEEQCLKEPVDLVSKRSDVKTAPSAQKGYRKLRRKVKKAKGDTLGIGKTGVFSCEDMSSSSGEVAQGSLCDSPRSEAGSSMNFETIARECLQQTKRNEEKLILIQKDKSRA